MVNTILYDCFDQQRQYLQVQMFTPQVQESVVTSDNIVELANVHTDYQHVIPNLQKYTTLKNLHIAKCYVTFNSIIILVHIKSRAFWKQYFEYYTFF